MLGPERPLSLWHKNLSTLYRLWTKILPELLTAGTVSWALSSSATEQRELAALADARKETDVDDCTVVTWDEARDVDGIRIVPAWKWCLEQESHGSCEWTGLAAVSKSACFEGAK